MDIFFLECLSSFLVSHYFSSLFFFLLDTIVLLRYFFSRLNTTSTVKQRLNFISISSWNRHWNGRKNSLRLWRTTLLTKCLRTWTLRTPRSVPLKMNWRESHNQTCPLSSCHTSLCSRTLRSHSEGSPASQDSLLIAKSLWVLEVSKLFIFNNFFPLILIYPFFFVSKLVIVVLIFVAKK